MSLARAAFLLASLLAASLALAGCEQPVPEPGLDTATPPTASATPRIEPGSGTSAGASPTPTLDPQGREVAVVTEVIDGDTIVLEDGRRLRYIGIDTPETVAPGEPVACFGPEASTRNEALVLDQTVYLERDVSDTDRFDRLLRYVYLQDGRMVNEILVEEGFAISKGYDPDTMHQALLDAAQAGARTAGLGIWASCALTPAPTATIAVTPTPPGPPTGTCPEGCEVPPEGCLVKGNISSEHIYYVPGQRDYENTVITPDKGERWFCTEEEAVANGWRPAQR